MKKRSKEKKWMAILIAILVVVILVYAWIIRNHLKINQFAEANMEVYQNNEEQVFQVERIVLCSSANAIDLSQEQNLQNLSIYQYTDIAVYINNGEELSNKNTVKELYIDQISLEGTDTLGSKSLNYKNILNFGLKQEILAENRSYKF